MKDSDLWEILAFEVSTGGGGGLCSALTNQEFYLQRDEYKRARDIIRARMKAGPICTYNGLRPGDINYDGRRITKMNCSWAWPVNEDGKALRRAFALEIARLYRKQGR